MKQALNIEFEIKEKIPYEEQIKKYHTFVSDGKGFWVYKTFKSFSTPNYEESEDIPISSQNEDCVA